MIPAHLSLPSGLAIEDVQSKLDGLFSRWYDLYDAVYVRRDDTLRPEEIALCIMMNSRMSGNTGLAVWQCREAIESGLQRIPPRADLAAAEVPWDGIQALLDPFQFIPRAKLGIATKVLHKKRPGLIPMLDTLLQGHYHRHLGRTRAKTLGGYAVNLMGLFREDLLAVLPEVSALCSIAAERQKPVTPVRMLDHMVWSVLMEKQS
jgi:hypothetical protein